MAVTGRSVPVSTAAISRALGRWEVVPATYLTARPIARPASSVIRRARTVVRSVSTCTTEYTPTATHRAFRHAGRPTRPTMVAYATRPARYGSRAATWLTPGRDMTIAS